MLPVNRSRVTRPFPDFEVLESQSVMHFVSNTTLYASQTGTRPRLAARPPGSPAAWQPGRLATRSPGSPPSYRPPCLQAQLFGGHGHALDSVGYLLEGHVPGMVGRAMLGLEVDAEG